jgi:serine/threonine protein kinase/CheY-like chemotaxis protein
MIVDDEANVLTALKSLLRSRRTRKYQVLLASSAMEALGLLREQEVHVILSDQRMPGMSGDVFLSHARKVQPDAIRILFTGYADIRAVIDAINEGRIYRYVLKPWNSDELLAIIQQAVEHHDLLTERKRLFDELQEKNRQFEEANTRLRELTEQLLRANAALLNTLGKDTQQLGQYRLLEKLKKQGGMGTVYKAVHVLLMKIMAVKVLHADRMHSNAFVSRFRREMKAVGRLNHPNIVQANDAGEKDGTYYLVMEFIEGIDLATLVACRGPLPIVDACEIVRQAAVGLQHAHEHGLVHRDLKPSNLMLSNSGVIKMLDLGLARLCDEGSASNLMSDPGQVMGTADYMAPEQAFGLYPVDIRADIYSLGCTLYHLLAGNPPFSGPEYGTPMRKLLAHSQAPVTPIRGLRGDVSEELAILIDRLIAKTPGGRLSEPAELAVALAPFSVGSDLISLLRSIDLGLETEFTAPTTTGPQS